MVLALGCKHSRRLLGVLVASLLVLPAVASAAPPGAKGGGPLSPPLEELSAPSLSGRSAAVQAERLGLPLGGPGSLIRDGGRVVVIARFAHGAAAALPALRAAGARILAADGRTQTVTLSIPPIALPALASVPALRAVWQAREPVAYTPAGQCDGGAVISEGLGQLRVDDAREAFELRGKGITVGVLSDSFDKARLGLDPPATDALDDVFSGDLPGPAGTCSDQQLAVDVLDEGPSGGGDEGRAMLQIVHDLAPHAKLAFATAFKSEDSFAQNIEALARPVAEGGAGADVILDDVAWFEEPFFQDGPVAVAIDKVTGEGVTYLSAAGNDNLFDGEGNEIASWEAPAFRDSAGCPEAISKLAGFNGVHCLDFNPGIAVDRTFGITVEPNEVLTLDLQWAEPWNGVGTDLDAFLLSDTGKLLTSSAEENTGGSGTQRPFEVLQWENASASERTVQLAVNRFSGGNPRLKFILLQNGGGVSETEYPESSGGDVVGPTVYGHAGAESTIAVGAVPFVNSAQIELYSSRGPVTHYFGPVNGTTPAAPLGIPAEVPKPDLVATDCGATTFFASFASGVWRFCGTSAAVPHAGAVAALVRQAKPNLPGQQVRDALTETAVPVGVFGEEAAGAGLIDAFEALGSLPGPIEGGDGFSEQVPPLEVPTQPGGTQATTPSGPLPQPQPSLPLTRILKHPPKLVRTRGSLVRLRFRLGSDQVDATFLCKVDRGRYRSCPARFARRYAVGRHLFEAKARGSTGLVDPTPAVYRFRVIRSG